MKIKNIEITAREAFFLKVLLRDNPEIADEILDVFLELNETKNLKGGVK